MLCQTSDTLRAQCDLPEALRHESDFYDDKWQGKREERGRQSSSRAIWLLTHALSSWPYRGGKCHYVPHGRSTPTRRDAQRGGFCNLLGGRPDPSLHMKCHVEIYLISFSFFPHLWTSNIFFFFILGEEAICRPCIIFSHFLILQNQNWCQKYSPALQSSVNMSVLLFDTDIIFSWQPQPGRQNIKKRRENQMEIWHDRFKHSQDSLQQIHARAGTRGRCSRNQWQHGKKHNLSHTKHNNNVTVSNQRQGDAAALMSGFTRTRNCRLKWLISEFYEFKHDKTHG